MINTYICLLRGVNVSGSNKISMQELRNALADAGFKEIKTYIQSGNVVLNTLQEDPKAVAALVGKCIEKNFKLSVPVITRTANELEGILAKNPFFGKEEDGQNRGYYAFLSDMPSSGNIKALESTPAGGDECKVAGNGVYIFCQSGFGNTKLNNNFIEKKLSLTATTRNMKTIQQLKNMAKSQ